MSLTLDEALSLGRGVERPFRCPVHEDKNASASVNVLKGVWFCYACQARGTVDGKKAPSTSDLLAMLEPESAARNYPEAYLELFQPSNLLETYWSLRFPEWLIWWAKLGQDPFTGAATFPVRTPEGRLAGVGRRQADPEVQPRYKYPRSWSASRVLGGTDLLDKSEFVVLVEGYADAVSLWEIGVPALACFGAGLHYPQIEALLQRAPRAVLPGFDMDDAGNRAAAITVDLLKDDVVIGSFVHWRKKDPADCSPDERREAVSEAVGGDEYVDIWHREVALRQEAFQRYLDER